MIKHKTKSNNYVTKSIASDCKKTKRKREITTA